MRGKLFIAAAVFSAMSGSAWAEDRVSSAHAASQNDGSELYIGGAYAHSWTNINTGGLNTAGPHFNFDCAGFTVDVRTCDDTASASGGSLFLGLTRIYSFTENASLRGEIEYNYRGGTEYVTGSFPGAPTPTFLYSTTVSAAHTGFMNLYFDYSMPNTPLTLYFGGGVGASNAKVSTNDFVVTGSKSETNLAYNFGVGANYGVSEMIDIFGDVRYVDLGSTSVPLTSISVPAGEYTVDNNSFELRIGVKIKLGHLAMPWNN